MTEYKIWNLKKNKSKFSLITDLSASPVVIADGYPSSDIHVTPRISSLLQSSSSFHRLRRPSSPRQSADAAVVETRPPNSPLPSLSLLQACFPSERAVFCREPVRRAPRSGPRRIHWGHHSRAGMNFNPQLGAFQIKRGFCAAVVIFHSTISSLGAQSVCCRCSVHASASCTGWGLLSERARQQWHMGHQRWIYSRFFFFFSFFTLQGSHTFSTVSCHHEHLHYWCKFLVFWSLFILDK